MGTPKPQKVVHMILSLSVFTLGFLFLFPLTALAQIGTTHAAGGGLNIFELYQQMGLLAKAVFWVLVAMSVWSFYVAISRYVLLHQARSQSMQFIKVARPLLDKNRIQELIKITKRFSKSHMARIYSRVCYELTTNIELHKSEESDLTVDQMASILNRAVYGETQVVTAELKKNLSGLATIGATAPFVGLFGTVIGVINAFTGIADAGAGGIGAVSAGIAEALIETAVGLFVAIPAVWLFNYFINKVGHFTAEMEGNGSDLVDYFLRKGMRI
ncbi:MotA/TolQ/ExbB proton channel family protein [candidate division CSSED10-310 bacterium]|uniref:MotA/TolQ/ExbB proton channel family protein n=1 Tax=candidate division CSSED10-310 bacterium TaxID=2855610 RepID=A0ABV6YUN6_UNCC1